VKKNGNLFSQMTSGCPLQGCLSPGWRQSSPMDGFMRRSGHPEVIHRAAE